MWQGHRITILIPCYPFPICSTIQSLCKQLVKSHTCPPHRPIDVHYCGLNVFTCHLHSELKDVACTITTQQAPAESAQELCSASKSNCETYTRSGNPAGRSQLEKSRLEFFHSCAASSQPREEAADCPLPALRANISPFAFSTKSSRNHFPRLNKSCGRKGK